MHNTFLKVFQIPKVSMKSRKDEERTHKMNKIENWSKTRLPAIIFWASYGSM